MPNKPPGNKTAPAASGDPLKPAPHELFDRPVDVTRLINRLDFTMESLVAAELEQAKLFEEVARYRVQALGAFTAAELRRDQVRAETELTIRKRAAAADEKITEGNVKAQIETDAFVRKAEAFVITTRKRDEYSKLLVEAYRHRRDAMQDVATLVGRAEAAEQRAKQYEQEMKKTQRALKEKYPGGE
jgi:hypothetical protein